MPYRGVDYKKSARFHPKVSLVRYAILRASGILDAYACPLTVWALSVDVVCKKDVSFTLPAQNGLSVGMRVDDFAPIQVTAIQCHDQHLCSSDIGSNGNVVLVAHAHQLVLGLTRIFARSCISEVQKQVYLIICYARSDLLFTALLTRQKSFNLQTGCFGNILCGNAGSAQMMLAEHAAIGDTKLSHQFFLHVACNDSYLHNVSLRISGHNLPFGQKPYRANLIIYALL